MYVTKEQRDKVTFIFCQELDLVFIFCSQSLSFEDEIEVSKVLFSPQGNSEEGWRMWLGSFRDWIDFIKLFITLPND